MMRRILRHAVVRVALGVTVTASVLGCVLSQPTWRRNVRTDLTVDPVRLRAHVDKLSRDDYPRDWTHVQNLEASADYIAAHFSEAGAVVEFQDYEVQGRRYRNVIGRFGPVTGAVLVVGAHYDACEDTPGADDNASGVAALIELGHLLGRVPVTGAVELVAYTLEEPPFFMTRAMGSVRHAARLTERAVPVVGVIVLEMVGYFDDTRGSQAYPSLLLKLIYPSRGNFIAVVGRWDQGAWVKAVKVGMKGATELPVYSIRAPSIIPGVDFSDHRSYWPHGYKAVMITDTAFYRNERYHSLADTVDSLDYERMADVVLGTFEAVRSLSTATARVGSLPEAKRPTVTARD